MQGIQHAADPYPLVVPEPRPAPGPLCPVDPPMVPFALAGIGAWAVAGLILLATGAPADWLRICLVGFLLGFPGLAVMAVHDRNRRRCRTQANRAHREDLAGPEPSSPR